MYFTVTAHRSLPLEGVCILFGTSDFPDGKPRPLISDRTRVHLPPGDQVEGVESGIWSVQIEGNYVPDHPLVKESTPEGHFSVNVMGLDYEQDLPIEIPGLMKIS